MKGEIGGVKLIASNGNRLVKWKRRQAYGITVQLCSIEEDQRAQEKIPEEMKRVLDQFSEVFAEPQRLPPNRSHDHGIPLKGAKPFQIKPYRCPYVQKSEIENLFREIL